MLTRRALLAGTSVGCLAGASRAQQAFSGATFGVNNTPWQVPEVVISAGQSWRGISYSDLTLVTPSGYEPGVPTNYYGPPSPGFDCNVRGLLTPGLIGNGDFPSGTLPISAGIGLPAGTISGIVNYTPSMQFPYPSPASGADSGNACSMGRIAVLTQQLFRQQNQKTQTPVIEYCMEYPGSAWFLGGGGGLGPNVASFTGAIGNGSGGAGTTLTVADWVSPNPIILNQLLFNSAGGEIAQITAFVSGTGGNGTYTVSISQNVSAEPMTTMGQSWYSMLQINSAIVASLPNNFRKLLAPSWKSVRWTQGGSLTDSTAAGTVTEWGLMTAAYDALDLPGAGTTGMLYYVGIRAASSYWTVCEDQVQGSWEFVRANANGRTVGTSPWYQWTFDGYDQIHTGGYGMMRNGEFEGLAAYITEDEGVFFTPLWASLTLPIVVSSETQTVTIPFDRPAGAEFASGALTWMSEPQDGIKVWPQYGFHLYRGGVEIPLSGLPVISGLNVVLTPSETINPGDVIEVSYCWYGPGGPPIPDPGPCAGIGGNLTMPGPASLLFPGLTINAWAWPYLVDVVAT